MKTLFILLLLMNVALAADDKSPATAPGAFTYRVTGLFSPDRVSDLREALLEVPGIQLDSIDFEHAEGKFIYDPAVVFKGVKPDDIAKRFDEKLRSVTNGTFGIQPLCTAPRESLKHIEIAVEGLDCKACCLAAYESISKIDGVAQATASFKEGRVTALIDPAKTDQPALEGALKKRGVALIKPGTAQ